MFSLSTYVCIATHKVGSIIWECSCHVKSQSGLELSVISLLCNLQLRISKAAAHLWKRSCLHDKNIRNSRLWVKFIVRSNYSEQEEGFMLVGGISRTLPSNSGEHAALGTHTSSRLVASQAREPAGSTDQGRRQGGRDFYWVRVAILPLFPGDFACQRHPPPPSPGGTSKVDQRYPITSTM